MTFGPSSPKSIVSDLGSHDEVVTGVGVGDDGDGDDARLFWPPPVDAVGDDSPVDNCSSECNTLVTSSSRVHTLEFASVGGVSPVASVGGVSPVASVGGVS